MSLDIENSEAHWGFKGKNYLFLIAINKYKYWTPLKCAVKDVENFAKVVTSRYQFEQANITFLKDTGATGKNILRQFKALTDNVTEHDNLVIYFAGHGHFMSKTGYWIPVDARFGDEWEEEFINTAVVVDRLRKIDSLHTLLIIDACFSGSLTETAVIRGAHSEKYKSRRVFTSGRADQVVSDQSPFARAIQIQLEENKNPYIYASQLIAEVRAIVERESKQVPTDARVVNSDDDGGDFVFHLKLSEPEIWAEVVRQNTKDAYETFGREFPNSTHYDEANKKAERFRNERGNELDPEVLQKINKLNEMKEWEFAQRVNTFISYQNFVQSFPMSKHIDEATKKMGEFDDMALNVINLKLAYRVQPLSFRQKIDMCIDYFDKFPAANNNTRVKQIKDDLEINRLKSSYSEKEKNFFTWFLANLKGK